ncbi:hypothetical protein TYRP_012751 [Tyrophagus putrescentiae]|nr:hypothetical protein TYRP_012751 [Tyrophagus putrescentiae]
MISSREVAKSAKSLICLLQSCTGKVVQVELRNDTYCLGTLQSIDCNMNTELVDTHIWSVDEQLSAAKLDRHHHHQTSTKQVVVISTEPSEELLLAAPKVDYLFIKGSRIRYVHLPPEIDILESIEAQLGTFRRRRRTAATTERPFNWKSYRKRQKLEKMEREQQQQQQQQQLSSPSTSFTPPPPPPPPPPPAPPAPQSSSSSSS